MDAEDRTRALSNKQKLLKLLQERRVLTNEEARRIAGSRAMARAWELQRDGYPITIRKLSGAVWELRFDLKPLGAIHQAEQKSLFS